MQCQCGPMLQANGKKEFAQPHMSVVRPKCKQHWHSSAPSTTRIAPASFASSVDDWVAFAIFFDEFRGLETVVLLPLLRGSAVFIFRGRLTVQGARKCFRFSFLEFAS